MRVSPAWGLSPGPVAAPGVRRTGSSVTVAGALVPNANQNAMHEVLNEHRLSVQEITNKFKLYSGFYTEVKK